MLTTQVNETQNYPVISAFKTILIKFLKANGDMLKMANRYKSAIKCFVKETYPHFLVTDGVFYTSVSFTQQALDSFKSCAK